MKPHLLFLAAILSIISFNPLFAQTTTINGPAGSGLFGNSILVLPNGNYVVSDPGYDDGATADVGAVYLYNGKTNELISTLRGSTAGDQVGYTVWPLTNGNYVVLSNFWSNGAALYAGAVTWCSAATGVNGVVSSSNSLVGSTTADIVGGWGITELTNGNYVINSAYWNNGPGALMAGAVTWASGTAPITGVLSSSNSIVGTKTNDRVGMSLATSFGIQPLSNGNFVVRSHEWDNGSIVDAGAVTWGNGVTGTSGVVSSANSMVGSTAGDQLGFGGIFALSNGNFVVSSYNWDNGSAVNAGAATWGNGTSALTGVVSSSNSLVGNKNSDQVSSKGIAALNNGNYVVSSPNWGNSSNLNAGAATWGNGTTGTNGVVSSANSLTGTNTSDLVSEGGIKSLANGHYVVISAECDNGSINSAGAVTWGNGTVGVTGAVNTSNSLMGGTTNNRVGLNNQPGFESIAVLPNGNYVVGSREWDNVGATNAGAATFCNGTTGTTGIVTSANSLVGTTANDRVSNLGLKVLGNGNYIVISYLWNGNAGAVTWGSATTGVSGAVSSANSLIGGAANNEVGRGGVVLLNNGNYVVSSTFWDNGAATNAGATTWGNGATGTTGIVGSSNSIIGSTTNDQIGSLGIFALTNGNYTVSSHLWDNGGIVDAGACTWGNGTTGTSGIVSSSNSLVGSSANDQVSRNAISLTNGNYVVRSPYWDDGGNANAGAATWANGNTGITGTINTSNSLIGMAGDSISRGYIQPLPSGSYFISSPEGDNGSVVGAGIISFGMGNTGVTGYVNSCNSIKGSVTDGGGDLAVPLYAYSTEDLFMVGFPVENKIVIYRQQDKTLATANTTKTEIIAGNGTVFFADASCSLLAGVAPAGANPVSDSVKTSVWIEGAQSPTFGKRHYEIAPAKNAATATGKVTLYFTQQEFNDYNFVSSLDLPIDSSNTTGISNLRIEKRGGASSDGSGLPNTYSGSVTLIDPNDNDIVWNTGEQRWEVSFNVTGFSGFFLTTAASPLPVTLLSFTGHSNEKQNILQWETTTEMNCNAYELQRSNNGKEFEELTVISAKNKSSNYYAYADQHPLNGNNYYRLKIKAMDGSYHYSNIVLLVNEHFAAMSIYPNPASNQLTIKTDDHVPSSIVVRDITGHVIMQVKPENTTTIVDVTAYKTGMYLVEVYNGVDRFVERVNIMR